MIAIGLEAEVREEYAYLSDEDLEFAPLFLKAYPRQGSS